MHNLCVGWNVGGIGTTTIVKVLELANIKAHDHFVNEPYGGSFSVRILPITAEWELDKLLEHDLRLIRDAEPNTRIVLVLNRVRESEKRSINSKAMESGLDVIATLQPDRRLKDILQKDRLPLYLAPFVDSVKHALQPDLVV